MDVHINSNNSESIISANKWKCRYKNVSSSTMKLRSTCMHVQRLNSIDFLVLF